MNYWTIFTVLVLVVGYPLLAYAVVRQNTPLVKPSKSQKAHLALGDVFLRPKVQIGSAHLERRLIIILEATLGIDENLPAHLESKKTIIEEVTHRPAPFQFVRAIR
jgi:hypothetical protein